MQLEYPLDGVYDDEEDARLFLGIANDGTIEDDLLDVRGPDFTDAILTVDGRAAVIPVPAGDAVHVGPEGSPSIVLQDLQTPLRSSESIPVTFVFEEAGEVTVDAMVAAEGPDADPVLRPPRLPGRPDDRRPVPSARRRAECTAENAGVVSARQDVRRCRPTRCRRETDP